MLLAADLHIHSCLSPCGDMAMTPNNLVNMAYIKGLELIALSDHNSAKNLPAAQAVAEERGILLLPALEVESREEVHVLCYLPDVKTALEFGEEIRSRLPDIENTPEFFGRQVIMDAEDRPVGEEGRLLIQSTSLSIEALSALCRSAGGVPVPAHINRSSNALLSNLGFIPPGPRFTAVEVYRKLPPPALDLSRYHVLHASDAHQLEDISEREFFLELPERSVKAALACLNAEKGL